MVGDVDSSSWSFLTSHGVALLAVTHDPTIRIRDLADLMDVTERTAQRVVSDLTAAGYVRRERIRRRNVYTVEPDRSFRLPPALEGRIGELLLALAPTALATATDQAGDPLATTQPLVLPGRATGADEGDPG